MPGKVPRRSLDIDPLAQAIAPASDETFDEKEARVSAEREAKRVSDAIDEELDRQRQVQRRAPKHVKVLLLGQSESGKSTTLKNFQLMSDPKAFRLERASWRAIIQLNVVQSIHVILEAMSRAESRPTTAEGSLELPHISVELLQLKARLTTLLKTEEILIRRLTTAGSGETEATQFAVSSFYERQRNFIGEVAVNSLTPWKELFTKFLPGRNSFDSALAVDWNDPDDPGRILHERAEDMKKLWNHPTIQDLLEKQNLRLDEMAGFFLDCLDEVTAERYLPSDDHILRARLKTMGVSEHRVHVSTGSWVGDWRIYDVGGHRSLRAAWAPYFDDLNAIIFLVPISAFDQVLAEAPKVNRLEDSVLLWTSIVSNKLLKDTNLILFLNKCDIMRNKLAAGIRFNDYVVSYGNRSNDFDTASNYLRKKFAGILKENSPIPRVFYCHLTAVIDRDSTKKVIGNVKDMVMRTNLKDSTLLL